MNKILSNWCSRYLSHPEAVVLLLIGVFSVVIFKTMGQVLVPVITSIVIAYLLFGLLNVLERLRCPHLLATGIVFLLFIGLLLLALLWLLPILWRQMVGLIAEIPMMLSRGQALIFKLHDMFPEMISVGQLEQVVAQITVYLANLGREIVTFSLTSLFGVVTIVVYLILVPLLVFFFLRDGKNIINRIADLLPQKRQVLSDVWQEMHKKIRSYIQGKIFEIVIVAVVTEIAFGILGLRYSILLGALVGLSVVIPYIGMIAVTIPIIIVGFIQWGFTAHFLYLMMVYAVINILDANVLVPLLFSGVMNLHPLAIILAVLIFGNLFGFWGVFFAIPLMTLVVVIVKSWPKVECQLE